MNKYIGQWCRVKDLTLLQTNDPPIDAFIFMFLAIKTSHGKKYGLVSSSYTGFQNVWQVPFDKLIFQIKERK